NKLLGYGYNFIHIPDYYAGAEIELIMQITEDDAFSSINVPQICNSDTVIRDFVMKNRVPLAVNMFLIVFGVLVVLVSAIFSSKNKKLLKLLCVGFFSLGIGCWSLCNYDLIILFTYDLRVKAYLEFGALYLVPLFVLLYFRRDDFIIRKRVINISYQVMLVMQICFDILAFALQFFNIVHFPKMLKIQHFILFVLCIGIISLTIYDFIKKQIHNKALIIGMTIMLIIGLLDMMKFTVLKYFVPMEKLQYVSIMCIGAMIFVLSQLVDFCVEIGQILLTGAKAQVLEEMAYHDDMTGIANRRRCEELWDSLDESRNNYGIFAFDLNFLKKTNDTKGHAMGDLLIQSFAQVLSKIFQEVGVVGRIGGDEFVVIIPDMNNVDKQELTKQLEEEIKRTNMENPDLHLSTAYGFCSHDEYPDFDSRKIYRKADEFMYEKKVAMKAARTD
ncbi:MAG: GGDEF domain-containing protein, partial [Lachnospiraceae bacterium]|nr:GGDEF domain-containing protein [Lachnospiraceae bacterium]